MRVGVDVGTVRVGVAACDPAGQLATPVTTLARDRRGDTDLRALADLVAERAAVEVVVGLPRTLAGADGPAAAAARVYAGRLAARVAPVPVRLVDERMTTVVAGRAMRAAGTSARAGRSRIDAAAAAALLQSALDTERATGRPAGEPVAAGG